MTKPKKRKAEEWWCVANDVGFLYACENENAAYSWAAQYQAREKSKSTGVKFKAVKVREVLRKRK